MFLGTASGKPDTMNIDKSVYACFPCLWSTPANDIHDWGTWGLWQYSWETYAGRGEHS